MRACATNRHARWNVQNRGCVPLIPYLSRVELWPSSFYGARQLGNVSDWSVCDWRLSKTEISMYNLAYTAMLHSCSKLYDIARAAFDWRVEIPHKDSAQLQVRVGAKAGLWTELWTEI